jgi:hypothetical protein
MSATPPRLVLGQCVRCGGGQKLVGPLHLEKGGPIVCLPCGTEWHAQQARERKQRERFIQGFGLGPSHAEPHELTLELLEEAIRLTHPDRSHRAGHKGDGRAASAQTVRKAEATTTTTE